MAISYAIIHRGGRLPCPPTNSPRRSRFVSCSATAAAHANIVKLEITKVEPAGPTHERISGKAYGELDPADPKNAVITDIELAPRNARGKVEYVTTFTLVRPTEMMKASGVLAVHRRESRRRQCRCRIRMVTSRSSAAGRATSFPTSTNHTIQVPVAKNRDGSSITGPLLLQFMNLTGHTARLVIPRGQPSPYPPASLDTTKASLISATGETANRREERRRENSEHRLGVRGLLDDAVSRKARSGQHLREERFQSGASLRAAIHGEGSARARHRPGGDARSRLVLQIRNGGRRRARRIRSRAASRTRSRKAARSRGRSSDCRCCSASTRTSAGASCGTG